jgi:AcrR family transcriptional regulator
VKERGSAEPLQRLPSGRHDIPKDVVIRSQRTRILQALAEITAERGYAATTVAQIVERAGVSSATFYELFHDKEDCFLAAVREIIAQATTVVSEAYGRQKEDVEQLTDGLRSLLDLFAAQPAFAALLFLECRSSTPRALDLYMSGTRVVISMLGRGWGSEVGAGVSPAAAARAVLGGAEAIIRKQIADGRAQHLAEVLPELVYCALVPFRGQDRAIVQARRAGQRALAPR